MSGQRTGVSTQLKEVEPRALFLHCHGHALNLAAGDAVKGCSVMKDALDITFEVSKLVKFSPKRSGTFDKLKEELATDSPGFRVLCPTRWTVRAASLKSVIDNYQVLQELWLVSKSRLLIHQSRQGLLVWRPSFQVFAISLVFVWVS